MHGRPQTIGSTFHQRGRKIPLALLVSLLVPTDAFVLSSPTSFETFQKVGVANTCTCRSWSSYYSKGVVLYSSQSPDDGDGNRSDGEEEEEEEVLPESVIRVDDGGSDLTDRFKYKVREFAILGMKWSVVFLT